MERFRLTPLFPATGRSRRVLLGAALATAGAASGATGAGSKKKRQKRCKPPTTKCGKKACCQPGEACVNRKCAAPGTTTTTTTTPAPLTTVSCDGPGNPVTAPPRIAQIFQATGAGSIATASFEVSNFAQNTPLGVEIRTTRNGVPTTTVLGTAFVFGLDGSFGALPVTANFAPIVAVDQGETYALVITNLVTNAFDISTRSLADCPRPFFADLLGNNNFVEQNASLVFTVSP